ncbi:MAG: hypothetical protein IPK97_12140 [Ahniella sp.]|nr:hypothetical protein [Ahniella sp.]
MVASLEAPGKTDYTRAPPLIQPVRLRFNHPAKPIDAGDDAKGFVLAPQLSGRWKWLDETTVEFMPATDWPIGASYDVRMDGEACCARMRPFGIVDLAFKVEAFSVSVTASQFYQDPTDPRIKRALFDLAFSHPVDPGSLESRLALSVRNAKNEPMDPPAVSVSYAPNRLTARVQSAPLTLPGEGGLALLAVSEGVKSLLGGEAFATKLELSLALPARNSLQVQSLEPTVVDNASGTPEQVLLIGFNQEVDERELMGKLRLRLLPEREPDPAAEEGSFDPSWYIGAITEKALKDAEELTLDLIPGEREVASMHSFRISLDPGRQILVEVKPGLSSFGQFVMPLKYQDVATAPDFPKLLRFVGEGGLLSLRGERRVSLALRNVPLAQMTVARVRPEELHHLVRFNEGEMVKPSLRGLGRDDLTERFSEIVESPTGKKRSAIHYAGVDLGRYWEAGAKGVFLLSVREISAEDRAAGAEEYSDPFDQYAYYDDEGSQLDRRLVVLSDLGVISKRQKNGERRVFVQNLKGGAPTASAMVSVIGRNGARVLQAVTDAAGVAILPDLSQFQREREPVLLLVEAGDDASFLPLNDYQRQLDFSRFDIGGESTPVDRAELRAHLFSDRGLYRPGETLHVGAIVRREDWQPLPTGAPLELQLSDPKGQVLSTRALALEASGFHEFSYDLAGHAPTGTYTVALLHWLDAKRTQSRFLGSTTLRVKEFQPDRMKVKSAFSPIRQALWLKPEALRIEVGVEHLFGGAAVGRRVATKLRLRPAERLLPGFEDYVFAATDPGFEVQEYTLDEQSTDEQGAVVLDTGLAGIETPHYQLDVMLEAFELEGGRSVSSDLATRISQADWLVGLKADDQNLALARGADRALHWIAIDAQGKPVDAPDLRFEIIEQRYVSILTRGDDGLYRYESRLKELPVVTKALAFNQGKASLPLPTNEPGDFRLRLFDGNQTQLAQVSFSVAGTGNATRALERNAELKLKLLNAEPEAGEELSLSIEAPYTGSGLITIERERVLAHVWFTTDNTVRCRRSGCLRIWRVRLM